MEIEELERLMEASTRAPAVLKRVVYQEKTELDIIKHALALMQTVRIGERELTLPGLKRNIPLILGVLVEFREKKKRNVMPLPFAGADDIAIEHIRPEIFDEDNFEKTYTAVGTDHIIPKTTGVYEVDEDEVIIITDLVEMRPDITVTAVQATVDEKKMKPAEMRKDLKISDLQMYELEYPWIADVSIDIDAKIEYTGTSELTPLGVHIALGKKIPNLT